MILVFAAICILVVIASLAFITSYLFYFTRQKNNYSSDIIIRCFAGLIVFGFGYSFCRLTGVSEWALLLLPVASVVILYKRRLTPVIKISWKSKSVWIHLFLFTFLNVNLFIQSYYMSAGEYCKEFFNVDSAAYLALLQGFLQSHSYPPLYLEISGHTFNYHYGAISLAAGLQSVTGVQPHTILFSIVPFIAAIGMYSLAYKIAAQFTTDKRLLLILPFVILTMNKFSFPASFDIKNFYHSIFRAEHFDNGFSMLSTMYGTAICIFIFYLVIRQNFERYIYTSFILLLLLCFYKIPYVPVAACAVYATAAYRGLVEKSIKRFLLIAVNIILLLSVAYFMAYDFKRQLSSDSSGFTITFNASNFLHLLIILLALSPMIIQAIMAKGKFPLSLFIRWAFFIVPSVIISIFINLNNSDYVQLYTMTQSYIIFPLFSLSFASFKKNIFRYSAAGVTTVMMGIVLFASINYSFILLNNKEHGHEYCNNENIAEALRSIPLKNSMIISNDLRYPANNYSRNIKQFQLSAIYGHQNYFTNLYFIDSTTKAKETRVYQYLHLLNSQNWDSSFAVMAKQDSITHLLIHKSYLQPGNLPMHKIFENAEYAVYEVK